MNTAFVIALISCLLGNILLIVQSYLKKKGANRATMEDAPTIKWLEENVKIRFSEQLANINAKLSEQNEKLKAGLSLTSQHLLAMKKLETEAIFDYNAKLFYWIYTLFNHNPFGYGLEDEEKEERAYDSIIATAKELIYADSKVDILVNNKSFMKVREDMSKAAISYQQFLGSITDEINKFRIDYYDDFGHMHDIDESEKGSNVYRHFIKKKEKLKQEKEEEMSKKLEILLAAFVLYKNSAAQVIKQIDSLE